MYMKYMFVCVYIYIYTHTQKNYSVLKTYKYDERAYRKKLNPQFVKIYVQFTRTILCQTHQKI